MLALVWADCVELNKVFPGWEPHDLDLELSNSGILTWKESTRESNVFFKKKSFKNI